LAIRIVVSLHAIATKTLGSRPSNPGALHAGQLNKSTDNNIGFISDTLTTVNGQRFGQRYGSDGASAEALIQQATCGSAAHYYKERASENQKTRFDVFRATLHLARGDLEQQPPMALARA
jgi:hypothetical protein